MFDTVTVGKTQLANRLVMSPMTRSRAAAGGLVTDLTAEYYAQRAGAGLIITEGVQPSVIGQGSIGTPGLHSAEQVAAWRRVTDAVHAEGGKIFAQLWHSGRVAHSSLYPDGRLPVAPSAVASGGQMFSPEGMLDHPTPHALSTAEVAQTVADFAGAARNAVEAGFDGVEIHGANGYLVHQFLSDNCNRRTDVYADRTRFALEVTHAVAEAIGPERTGIHLSPGNPYNNIEEGDPLGLYTRLLKDLDPGLAFVHLLEIGDRELVLRLRESWPGTFMLNPHTPAFPPYAGMHASPEAAEDALNVADLVSLGVMWLANPDLVTRIRRGGPYNEPDPATYYGGDHRGYTDYPAMV
ncbi:alkene reductase [Nonomuraea longicatena]|uniref:Alkene reductase n=1 Tax=Nonomuraea longicatena TaxID=83682 RepID=A0ABN1NWD1_9ACTN